MSLSTTNCGGWSGELCHGNGAQFQ